MRIEVSGAGCLVVNRGRYGGALVLDEADGRRFLCAVAALPERLALEVHGFVLMPHHDHGLVRTREANVSSVIRCSTRVTRSN